MKLTHLIDANVWRDGGSLSAAFETESNGALSFILRRAYDEKDYPIYGSYGNLFVYEGESQQILPETRRLELRGSEEAAILDALNEFLSESAAAQVQNDSEEKWRRLKQLIDALQRRKLSI